MIFKNGTVFIDNDFIKTDLRVENGVITEISETAAPKNGEEEVDCTNRFILPGLVEIHSHGCVGHDFSDASPEGIREMRKYYADNGITSVCATTMTMPHDDYRRAVKTISAAQKDELHRAGVDIIGINMEGPFLSAEKKGAHDARFLKKPDIEYFKELDSLSGNFIRIVGIDPEYGETEAFLNEFSGDKVISIAHTSCGYERAVWAFENGAKNVTHLFNAMNPLLHREPGVVGAFIDRTDKPGNIAAEIICDGFHIAPSVIRMMFRLCGDNMVLISDSMRAAGLSDGEYELGGIIVNVTDGKATQKDGTIAGSTANLFKCMVNAIGFGVPVSKAIRSATSVPAGLVCPEKKIGILKEGYDADIIVLKSDYKLDKVYLKGRRFK